MIPVFPHRARDEVPRTHCCSHYVQHDDTLACRPRSGLKTRCCIFTSFIVSVCPFVLFFFFLQEPPSADNLNRFGRRQGMNGMNGGSHRNTDSEDLAELVSEAIARRVYRWSMLKMASYSGLLVEVGVNEICPPAGLSRLMLLSCLTCKEPSYPCGSIIVVNAEEDYITTNVAVVVPSTSLSLAVDYQR